MIYRVRHKTHYRYNASVSLCYNLAHILPRDTPQQVRLRNRISIEPQPAYARQYRDYFGNHNYHFSIDGAHKELSVDVVSDIEIVQTALSLNLDLGNSCEQALQQLQFSTDHEVMLAREFALASPMIKPSEELRAYAAPSFEGAKPL